MTPRLGELFLIAAVVVAAVVFHRIPAWGDALSRLFGRRRPSDPPGNGVPNPRR
ncbi:MAG: hypothetical protein HY903_17985 [Deltaproteobacteria bacterium]|nr:hypothetical protein [Deltaproteobacteria bacterium]